MLPRSQLSAFSSFVLLLSGLASTGCSLFETKTTLADLAPESARITVDLNAEPMVHLELITDGACEAITDDVEAHVNDRQMDLFKRGGEQPSQGGWVCGAPTFRRALGTEDLAGPSTKFEVADETATINVEVEGLLAARTITTSAAASKMKAGEETEVTWSATNDQLDEANLDVSFVYDDTTLTLPAPASLRLANGAIFVKIPPGAAAGTGTLRINATVRVPATVCKGAKTCDAEVAVTAEAPLEILPAETSSP